MVLAVAVTQSRIAFGWPASASCTGGLGTTPSSIASPVRSTSGAFQIEIYAIIEIMSTATASPLMSPAVGISRARLGPLLHSPLILELDFRPKMCHAPCYSTYGSVREDGMNAARGRVSESGRLSIPTEFRKVVGVDHGGDVVVELAGREIRIRTVDEVVAQSQALTRRLIGTKSDASVDDFLAERHREAERE
jgi:bifunctional DNA-binding transcriptional regulator/antitoxin component of YhaV-PrlF toxin-antitoxin module